VVGIEHDSLTYERVYRVAPFVNPGSVTHVEVLKAARGSTFFPVPDAVKKP
jgi:hypothetical protein